MKRRMWTLSAIVVLALAVTISCALSPSNPTVGGGESEENSVFEIEALTSEKTGTGSGFSSEQCDPRGESELSEKCPVTQTNKTGEGSSLISPLVIIEEGKSAKEEKIFLPLFTKPRGLSY